MYRKKVANREPSGNRRSHHISTNIVLNHRVQTFPCAHIDDKGRAFILRELRAMRGTLTAKFQGDNLTCVFAHQRRQALNKLTKRISKMLRSVRQTNFMNINPAFA